MMATASVVDFDTRRDELADLPGYLDRPLENPLRSPVASRSSVCDRIGDCRDRGGTNWDSQTG